MMLPLLILGAVAFALALLFTPLCRNMALRLKLVDESDNVRKLHIKAVPRVGGVAIFASYAGAVGLALLPRSPLFSAIPDAARIVLQLLPAASVVFLTGLIDDLIGLKPWQKLLGQFSAAALACAMGVRIGSIQGHPAEYWWNIPLTIAWLIGCTNAINLIDGVDGLAAGVGLFATSSTMLAALLQGNVALAVATIPLAGCLLGFLRYNFNPASIFLGDSGSLVIGFMLGCYGIIWEQKSATLLGMIAPMMALAVPLLDVVLSIARRFIGDKPIFGADRGHIHHRLLARGLTPKAVALILYGVCGIAAAMSLLHGILPAHGGLIVVVFCAMAAAGIRYLSYTEFSVVHRMITQGTFRRILSEEIRLRTFQDQLEKTTSPRERWDLIRETSAEFGFHAAEWKLGATVFVCNASTEAPRGFSTQIGFGDDTHLKLYRNGKAAQLALLTRMLEILEEGSRREAAAKGAAVKITRRKTPRGAPWPPPGFPSPRRRAPVN